MLPDVQCLFQREGLLVSPKGLPDAACLNPSGHDLHHHAQGMESLKRQQKPTDTEKCQCSQYFPLKPC